MDKILIAHELGHALCAEVQDGFWVPSDLSFKREKGNGTLAYCSCDKRATRKPKVRGPYSRTTNIMNLGGLFGELLQRGCWSPWGCRADIDEFVTTNRANNLLKMELDDWMWVSGDDLSFRACSSINSGTIDRRKYTMDSHDTAKRLPQVWMAYLDFCDRIDKEKFKDKVDYILINKVIEVKTKLLKEMMGDVIL